jgi:hypothetical protein
MKKIMLALAMAGGHWLHAQSPKDSLSQKLNSIFAQVDPAKVSSGKIYDKGLALTNLAPCPQGGNCAIDPLGN